MKAAASWLAYGHMAPPADCPTYGTRMTVSYHRRHGHDFRWNAAPRAASRRSQLWRATRRAARFSSATMPRTGSRPDTGHSACRPRHWNATSPRTSARGAVTLSLARRLGAPAVLSGFSRLLIDANRGGDDPTLIMRLSDGAVIPGNSRDRRRASGASGSRASTRPMTRRSARTIDAAHRSRRRPGDRLDAQLHAGLAGAGAAVAGRHPLGRRPAAGAPLIDRSRRRRPGGRRQRALCRRRSPATRSTATRPGAGSPTRSSKSART